MDLGLGNHLTHKPLEAAWVSWLHKPTFDTQVFTLEAKIELRLCGVEYDRSVLVPRIRPDRAYHFQARHARHVLIHDNDIDGARGLHAYFVAMFAVDSLDHFMSVGAQKKLQLVS